MSGIRHHIEIRCAWCPTWATHLHLDATGVGQHVPVCGTHAAELALHGATAVCPEDPKKGGGPGWMRSPAAAEFLGIKATEIQGLLSTGILPSVKIAGWRYIRESSVRDLLEGEYFKGIPPRQALRRPTVTHPEEES